MQYDERLRRYERITDEREYKAVIRGGNPVYAKSFKVYLLLGSGLERRAGFIAGKAVGDAHRRNRAKRLLKEAFRRLKPRLRPDGFKIVFVARRGAAVLTYAEISREMEGLFERCGLLNQV